MMRLTHQTDRHQPKLLTARQIPLLYTLLLLTVILFSACSTGISEPQDIVFPESDVSYRLHVQPLFDISCSFSGCHDGVTRAGNLALRSYFDLLDRPGMVRPGDSTHSLLVQVTSRRQPHTAPISRLILPEQARGIAIWVQEGASNN